jgi:hypothetical protein
MKVEHNALAAVRRRVKVADMVALRRKKSAATHKHYGQQPSHYLFKNL